MKNKKQIKENIACVSFSKFPRGKKEVRKISKWLDGIIHEIENHNVQYADECRFII